MAVDELVHDERVNAIIGWLLTMIVGVGGIVSILTGAYLWGVLTLVIVMVIALPTLSTRDRCALVPWPLLLFAALAVLLRATGSYLELAGYVAITATALIIVVELDAFTPIELSRRFAVVFAVMTAMALQALWTIAQFYSDRWLGTAYLRSQTELQWDFVAVTVIGMILGTLAELYIARFEPVNSFKGPPSG